MDRNLNLDPLIGQFQLWWNEQHAACGSAVMPDPLGRPSEGLSFLYTHAEWLEYPVICPSTCGWRNAKSRDQLLESLRPIVKANAVRAAGLLDQPDAQVALQVADALVPAPYGEELTLVVDLIQAAGAQSIFERKRALKSAGIAATVVSLLLLNTGSRKAA